MEQQTTLQRLRAILREDYGADPTIAFLETATLSWALGRIAREDGEDAAKAALTDLNLWREAYGLPIAYIAS